MLIVHLMLAPRRNVLGHPQLVYYIKDMQNMICWMQRHKPPAYGQHGSPLASQFPLWGNETHKIILMEVAFSIHAHRGNSHGIPDARRFCQDQEWAEDSRVASKDGWCRSH